MKRVLFITFVLALVSLGCNKNKADTSDANDARGAPVDEAEAQPPGPLMGAPKTEVATGEMRELLLTLQRVHFRFDSAELIPVARDALDSAAKQLIEHGEISLSVDGHTDERGTNEYNMALGERRSKAVVDYLGDLGVPAERLSVTSFGEENPLADGSSTKTFAKNRRVDFRLLKGNIELVLEEGTLVDDEGEILDESA